NYGRHILRELQKAVPGVKRINMTVSGQGGEVKFTPASPSKAPPKQETAPVLRERQAEALDPAGRLDSSPLDSRFTFDSFVVGKPNELAHAAARRVAETADASFNPVFLYGGVGRGKTHLMHAIGWQMAETFPGRRVLYLSAEQFMYRFIAALRSRDTYTFKQQFRSVDVLMIDDVQFIGGKDSTQEEFFHTFNALVDQRKQIVLSADKSPEQIDGLEMRIKSRLQQGLVVDIHPADYELRLGILQQKVADMRGNYPEVEIETKVLEFLAHRISTNVRILEGALTRLFAFASLVNRPVDMDLTQECLADLLKTVERKVTIEEIKKVVSNYFNLRMSDLTSARRARTVARPRQMAMYLCKMLTPKSLPEIGRGFGNRDHTTVIHAVKTIEKLKETDGQLAEDLEALRRHLEGR
ncbi:MAG: chromosomal replication initiator protein DnaA, partial [Pseudomonadota bacterium]